ncbi:ATP-binding protein [Streptomyces cyaneofuscatus]|uniref:ATP-binding protein n=1 Tax=Streptomyces cyaneofuscatus TaxID=66883 RepID=UPI0033B0155C
MRSPYSHPQQLIMDLEADYSQLTRARSRIRQWLTGCGAVDGVDEVLLVVHEILANAIEHGNDGSGGHVEVRLRWEEQKVSIHVRDQGKAPDPPQVVPAQEAGECGRGLAIVEALAHSWGATTQRRGRSVWATLTCGPGGQELRRAA